jgi:hypothetical protein
MKNFQGLFAYPITIDGELEVDGVLIEVGITIDSDPGQIFFDDNGSPTGNAGLLLIAHREILLFLVTEHSLVIYCQMQT